MQTVPCLQAMINRNVLSKTSSVAVDLDLKIVVNLAQYVRRVQLIEVDQIGRSLSVSWVRMNLLDICHHPILPDMTR